MTARSDGRKTSIDFLPQSQNWVDRHDWMLLHAAGGRVGPFQTAMTALRTSMPSWFPLLDT
jgi:hypothetical protein